MSVAVIKHDFARPEAAETVQYWLPCSIDEADASQSTDTTRLARMHVRVVSGLQHTGQWQQPLGWGQGS